MPSQQEAICAQITAPGYSAVSLIRVSGRDSIEIVAKYFRPRGKLLKLTSQGLILGSFYDRGGFPLDQVLCAVFRAPASYTGEDCVEISCHGNPEIVARVLENLLLEARLARPGEFTLRALLNGKMDLVQAEAVNDLILATGSLAGTAALMQVQGQLSSHLGELLEQITAARLRCELAIDFADQDLPQIDLDDLRQRISGILEQTRLLQSEGRQGRIIREGIRVLIAGPPNSGKSSLFNAFLRYNRAIVTPHPGTTRDYLEERVALQGYTLILTDTAGLRDTRDSIERQGIERSFELMRSADLILHLSPADQARQGTEDILIPPEFHPKTLWLLSKSDLAGPGLTSSGCIPVTVIREDGLDQLKAAIMERFQLQQPDLRRPLVTNARHLAALQRCEDALVKALDSLRDEAGFEFTAFDLIAASKALEEILGVISSDDLLERIFSNFCIGK
ncbi:MAG TPA: tRNA uridine-5-carboxymethylaminomethyl(34) synthesis GTPase MnmE [Candidatus Cloacimonadota bacterium]|nr:tRNA uridine-5-carboxymethylaminomethyl(34) synthesis GTPase MnmE [Candidatus Cloacimonadota bacterium]HOG30562.1 tRNA uridine-5-carboxymethylaminomethyl(34) synthesis GTPase MnmE [Candidatus Cloacimonadota bacterium]HPB08322.1 tRNA uridine-5-carboxymethylaminomethyl(34) synthesis GTPase MnmE [Candidatus Cloacimonadota bacterium]HPL23583.1 tRNA uridine-5-carboxymethylaminomethyl(34) synthesis GTPase MnmE [Candidatus Cloacimonadota bacterium]HQL12841.1 tRNA uridine-5-carboxymethylaminomethyl(